MSITYELGEYADGCFAGPRSAILAIADRIDAEHESKVSYWQGASYKDGYDEGFASADDWLAQHEDAMAEHGWVKLPKDADGEYIHIGDMMWQKDHITKRSCKAIMGCKYVMLDGIQGAVYAGWLTHYHAPTVEDVLREFAKKVCEGDHIVKDGKYLGIEDADLLSEYAAKLQLRESE